MIEFTKQELENEMWKDVPDYENLYQISNLGRVKSLLNGKIKILSTGLYDKYVVKSFCKDGVKIQKGIHRVVMLAFVGKSDLFVDHVNGIRSDNRLSNLRYVTHRENIQYFIERFKKVGCQYVKKRNKWRSTIRINKEIYLNGYFDTKEEASKAYQTALYNWENFGLSPYEVTKNTNEYKGLCFIESLNKYVVSFQRGGHNIFLGKYEEKSIAIKVYRDAIKSWEERGEIPIYINPKKSSIYKYIYFRERTNKWNLKINGRTLYFKSEEEAVNTLLNYKNNNIFSQKEVETIKKYYTPERIEKLNNIFKNT